MTQPVQYQIKDPQGGVYGPAAMPTILQWIREGRISAAMQLAPEGTQDWRAITSFPELAAAFGPAAAGGPQGYAAGGQGYAGSPYGAGAAGGMSYGAVSKTNGMAIAALVCSLVPICMPIGGILGIVFGTIAKSQIRQSNGAQTGQGLATAGIIIGIIHVILSICLIGLVIAIKAYNID